jgi:hypothetical protein
MEVTDNGPGASAWSHGELTQGRMAKKATRSGAAWIAPRTIPQAIAARIDGLSPWASRDPKTLTARSPRAQASRRMRQSQRLEQTTSWAAMEDHQARGS